MNMDDRKKKHPLGSGIPCVNHKCVKCCLETEMSLSHFDIKRILELGYRLQDFAVKTGKEWRLKNRCGQCIFLSTDGCTIYSHRPDGCRIYPLVYDEAKRKAVMHRLCPYHHEFEVREGDIDNLKIQLKTIFNN